MLFGIDRSGAYVQAPKDLGSICGSSLHAILHWIELKSGQTQLDKILPHDVHGWPYNVPQGCSHSSGGNMFRTKGQHGQRPKDSGQSTLGYKVQMPQVSFVEIVGLG
jgi:hypothetical protein